MVISQVDAAWWRGYEQGFKEGHEAGLWKVKNRPEAVEDWHGKATSE